MLSRSTLILPLFSLCMLSACDRLGLADPAKEAAGNISLRKNICLACHHPILRKQYLLLLKNSGIIATDVTGNNIVRIQGEKNVKKFAEKIGFIEGIKVTKHSKFWVGREKNEVMRLMLDSYDDPRKFINLLTLGSKDIVRTA